MVYRLVLSPTLRLPTHFHYKQMNIKVSDCNLEQWRGGQPTPVKMARPPGKPREEISQSDISFSSAERWQNPSEINGLF